MSLARVRTSVRAALLMLLILCVACRPGDFPPSIEYVEKLNEQNMRHWDKHDDNMTRQHQTQTPEKAAELEALRKETEKRFAEIAEDARQLKYEVKNPLEALGTTVAGIGGKLLGIDIPVREWVKDNVDKAKEEVTTETDSKVALASAGVTEKAKTMVDSVKTDLVTLRDSLKSLELAKELDDKDLASLRDSVNQKRQELEAALNDPAKLRSTVLTVAREAGLRPEAIQALEKAKDDDLYNLILTLLGGGALGGVASRLGPSRNAKEIEELKRTIEASRSARTGPA